MTKSQGKSYIINLSFHSHMLFFLPHFCLLGNLWPTQSFLPSWGWEQPGPSPGNAPNSLSVQYFALLPVEVSQLCSLWDSLSDCPSTTGL